MKRLLVVGAGGHSNAVVDLANAGGDFEVVGLIDGSRGTGDRNGVLTVLGGEADIPALVQRERIYGVAVAVGDNAVRQRIVRALSTAVPQLRFPVLVHPRAVVSATAEVGEGSVVMAGAIIGAGSNVGRFCIVNTRSSLDHDGSMGDFSSLAPGVVTGGGCRLGSGCAIGIGAVIRHGMEVGENAVVGAGAVVLRDVPAGVVAYGSPAVVVRARATGDPYL